MDNLLHFMARKVCLALWIVCASCMSLSKHFCSLKSVIVCALCVSLPKHFCSLKSVIMCASCMSLPKHSCSLLGTFEKSFYVCFFSCIFSAQSKQPRTALFTFISPYRYICNATCLSTVIYLYIDFRIVIVCQSLKCL